MSRPAPVATSATRTEPPTVSPTSRLASCETALLAGFLAQVDRSIIAEVPADLDLLLPLRV